MRVVSFFVLHQLASQRDMKNWIFIVVGASLLWAPGTLRASSFATEVIDYEPGEGFAKDWATGAGFTKTGSILGPPSSVTQGEFGGLVTPFSPPYLLDQILSVSYTHIRAHETDS